MGLQQSHYFLRWILHHQNYHLQLHLRLLTLPAGTNSCHFGQKYRLNLKQTLATWSVIQTLVSVIGLGMTLLLWGLLV